MPTFFLYWREILSLVAVIIAMYSYISYIRSTFRWTTEPHIFSWGIWTLTTGIAFFAQVAGWWGWGTAQNGVTFFVCIVILGIALKYWKKDALTWLDWSSLALSGLAIGLWVYTSDPLYASLFATVADMIWYIPTLRKVWKKPLSEPTGYYLTMNVKHGLSLSALSLYSWTTMVFSASIIVMNFILIGIQYFRKK